MDNCSEVFFCIINYLASAAQKNKAFGYFLSESLMYSAGKETWTLMVLLPHGPEPCASANSAIPARQNVFYMI